MLPVKASSFMAIRSQSPIFIISFTIYKPTYAYRSTTFNPTHNSGFVIE